MSVLKVISILFLVILLGVPVYAIPATLSLTRGRRQGLSPLTIPQAAERLQSRGLSGWDLVEAARALVEERMHYSRRNSFDPASKAFERGYGYCQQQAFALAEILTRLGVQARVVHAFRNRFPDGGVGGHAWVEVALDGEARFIDSIFYNAESRSIDFTPLSKVWEYNLPFRLFSGWGSTAANAQRYYKTGVDF